MVRATRTILTGMVILFFAAASWSAPRGIQNEDSATRIWTLNLGRNALELKVKRTLAGTENEEILLLESSKFTEVRRSAGEEIQIPQLRDLLVVTGPSAFDPAAALRVDALPQRSERAAARREAVEGISPEAAGKSSAAIRLRRGEVVSSAVAATGLEPRTVQLSLLGPKSWAEIRLKTADGALLGYVTLGTARAVDVTLDVDQLLAANRYLGVMHREIVVHQGEVSVVQKRAPEQNRGSISKVTAAVTQGTGYFNYTRNWELTPPLRYYVEGGPANTCGESNVSRNGTWYFTPGWLCTDANGYAEKGPWYWSSQSDDETAEAFIRWPNGNATTSDWHYWDVRCPSVSITNNPFSHPPGDWRGPASDPPYGACFGGWSSVYATFQNLTTGRYWAEGANDYTLFGPDQVDGTLSGLPTCGADWQTAFPPAVAHVSGNQYRWTVCLIESADSLCEPCSSYDFTY